MQIEIINVSVENKGKYRVASVSYKDNNGRVDGKKNIMSFGSKDVFKTISEAQIGDKFDVKSEKNDKGYWEWIEVVAAGKNTSPSSTGAVESVRKSGGWETSEERAKRQVYIVRQSSISSAIALAELNKMKLVGEEDIIKSAKVFEEYVFGIEPLQETEVV